MTWLRRLGILVLVAFAARGVAAISSELDGLASAIPALVVIAVVGLRYVFDDKNWGVVIVVIGAMVVALMVLVGVDVVIGARIDGRLEPLPGLLVGLVIVALGAWAYVEVWPDRWNGLIAAELAGCAVALLVIAPPLVALASGAINGDGSSLTPEGNTGSDLEVIVLRDDAGPATPPPATSHGWSVTTWTGRVRRPAGADWTVDWGENGPPPAVPAQSVDRVLLLMADQNVDRWLRVADSVTPLATPTFAVLNRGDPSRVTAWKAALSGGGVTRRRGRALALDPLNPRQTSDLAVELAELSPSADQDLALAAQHRPALFFDTSERSPAPYNVERLIQSGKMRLCPVGQSQDALCPHVTQASQLHRDAGRLTFDPNDLLAITADPTVYVHVRHAGNDHPEAIYLDYWWYFPYNPAGAGDGAMCGAGFNLAGTTCFDHQSDWEGVTVVLDGDDANGPPTAVLYAQHNRILRYSWRALQEIWAHGPRERFGQGIDTGLRPLVFVAGGTHASYPVSCRHPGGTRTCHTQNVPGNGASGTVVDQGFDGARPWSENTRLCLPGCVTAFPTRREGEQRASWNAFAGKWGTADCVLGVICSESDPPQGPGEQDRYRAPWCASSSFDFDQGRWTFRRGLACADMRPPRSKLETGHRRVAILGDSFSSGQGAGNYRRGTHDSANTCFRSDGAWPLLVADALDWTPVGFLACSGARSDEVILDNAAHNDELERAHSQTGRIVKSPDVITLTIGGNDIGFASVVTRCVLADCKAAFHKPSGDVVDRRIDALGQRLPDVYRAIMRAAPGATLVVVDYPRLLPQGSRDEEADNCAAPGNRISADEVEYLNQKTEKLDAVIKAAANEAGARFVEVIDAFAGHELRCRGQSFVNPARIRGALHPASFHPNATGHVQLADVVARALANQSP